MRVLFVHSNFPGQFRDLAPALAADPANEVVFFTQQARRDLPGVRKVLWQANEPPGGRQAHRYVRDLERAAVHGQATWQRAQALRDGGFVPDVIYGHSGWGPTMFLKDAFPESKLVCYFDWYYRPRGTNGDFFPERPMNADRAAKFLMMNAPILIDLEACDWGVVTTRWQLQQFPVEFAGKFSLLHDGIDTDWFSPSPSGDPATEGFSWNDLVLPAGTELITYATRGMDPYRGFPTMLRAVDRLLKVRPNTHVVIAGEDRIPYGSKPPGGTSWREYLLKELSLPLDRVHFTGPLPAPELRQLLRASSAHVYFSAPFIPSWSMFEAMAAGCLLVGSATPPVEEVVTHGQNGLLVDFFDDAHLAEMLAYALDHQAGLAPLRAAARQSIVERYALRDLLPRQQQMLADVAAGVPTDQVEGAVAMRSGVHS